MGGPQLEAINFVGFNGRISNGLLLQNDSHLIYALGSSIIIQNVYTSETKKSIECCPKPITALELSKCGKLLAVGHRSDACVDVDADIIIWDLEQFCKLHCLRHHKVCITNLSFSCDGKYLASIGGDKDKTLVMWDTLTGHGICGSSIKCEDFQCCLRFFNTSAEYLITGEGPTIRTWKFNAVKQTLCPLKCDFGKMNRVATSLSIDEVDAFAYVGTTTGDILEINLQRSSLRRSSSVSRFLNGGASAIAILDSKQLLVGTRGGAICKVGIEKFTIQKITDVLGEVTSFALASNKSHFYSGTSTANIYFVQSESLQTKLHSSGHSTRINGVVFPANLSEIFATFSPNDIRIWEARTLKELLCITVSGSNCLSLAFSIVGDKIWSGWSDGSIKAFLPQSGRLLSESLGVHTGGVTAMVSAASGTHIISGGATGNIKLWCDHGSELNMLEHRKEHGRTIVALLLEGDETQFFSGSSDGVVIVWDTREFKPLQRISTEQPLRSLFHHSRKNLLVIASTPPSFSFWDVAEGAKVQEWTLMDNEAINCTAPAASRDYFVSGGVDKTLSLWHILEGRCITKSVLHPGVVNGCAIAPDQTFAVTVGEEGDIFIWQASKVISAVA